MTLVDTDVLIDAARGIPDALASLQTHGASGALAVSVITEMELIVGCRNKAELQALRRFLSRYSVRPVTAAVSQQASGLV
ncbi:MAG TPA: PIN domain-containing protein, partial [Rhodothermales bacterium]|nr:PIN domain-containing protein [Rhodothermales bacterium]